MEEDKRCTTTTIHCETPVGTHQYSFLLPTYPAPILEDTHSKTLNQQPCIRSMGSPYYSIGLINWMWKQLQLPLAEFYKSIIDSTWCLNKISDHCSVESTWFLKKIADHCYTFALLPFDWNNLEHREKIISLCWHYSSVLAGQDKFAEFLSLTHSHMQHVQSNLLEHAMMIRDTATVILQFF